MASAGLEGEEFQSVLPSDFYMREKNIYVVQSDPFKGCRK